MEKRIAVILVTGCRLVMFANALRSMSGLLLDRTWRPEGASFNRLVFRRGGKYTCTMDVWSTNVKDLNKLPHIMKDNYEKLEEKAPEVFAIVTHEYSKKSLLRRCKRLKIEGFAVKDDISIATGKLVDIRLGDMSTRLFFLGDKALPDVKGFLWSLDGHLQKKSA